MRVRVYGRGGGGDGAGGGEGPRSGQRLDTDTS